MAWRFLALSNRSLSLYRLKLFDQMKGGAPDLGFRRVVWRVKMLKKYFLYKENGDLEGGNVDTP